MFYVSRVAEDKWTPLSDGRGNKVPYRGKDMVTLLAKEDNPADPLELAHCRLEENQEYQPVGGVHEMYSGEILTCTNADTLCYRKGHIVHGLAKEFYPGQ